VDLKVVSRFKKYTSNSATPNDRFLRAGLQETPMEWAFWTICRIEGEPTFSHWSSAWTAASDRGKRCTLKLRVQRVE
jgi:hypothetical protein